MFAEKNYLILLLLIPLLIALTAFFLKKRKKDLSALISKTNLPVLSNVDLGAYKIKSIFFMAGFVFLIIALARPQYGYKEAEVEKKSSEVVIALDVSKSMLAQDVKPNRLEKAKTLISRIVKECEGDKIGVIVFSGASMWQCPMTYDGEAVRMFLNDVNTGVLPFGGTEFSSPINLAIKTIGENSGNSRAMVMITDGEDHDVRTKEAIESAKKAGLKIISVGIGTYQGAPIPVKSESGVLVKYVSDGKGKTVISKLNSGLLQKIAFETGGKYFEISDGSDITAAVVSEIKKLDKDSQGKTKEKNKRDAFAVFLFLALTAFAAEMFYPTVLRKK